MRDNVRQRLKENSEKNFDKVRLEMLSMMSIEERAKAYIHKAEGSFWSSYDYAELDAYVQGATEQKAIDDERIKELESFVERATTLIEGEKAFREHLESENKKLEEALKAFKAFCHNIINGVFIDNEKAAIEQLEYIKANFSKDFDWDTLEE